MRRICLLVVLCGLLTAGTAAAQDALIDLGAQSARAHRAAPRGRLAPGRAVTHRHPAERFSRPAMTT